MLFSMYDYIIKRPYGYCIFNTLYTKYVKIKGQEEVEHFEKLLNMEDLPIDDYMVKKLYENKFVVENDIDEYKLAKSIIAEHDKEIESCFSFLVYVTDQCNFRCVYCPEEHLSNDLSDAKWEALYKYIKRQIEEKNKKYLRLDFFGGEPLMKMNKILEFLRKMKVLATEKDVYMRFEFTSNGYLLTPENYDKLMEIGFPYSFQITVDGFAEQHDKTRPLANGAGTWNKIIENLKYINTKEDSTKIIIRTNVGNDNKDIVKEFHKWAKTVFTNKKFKFHLEGVGKYSDRVDDKYVYDPSNGELVDLVVQAAETVETVEMKDISVLSGACHMAEKGAFALAINGNIYKCENNYLYDETHDIPIGYMNDDGEIIYTQDVEKIETYEFEECETCQVYPICAGRSCPVRKMVDPVARLDCYEKGKAIEYSLIKKLESGALDRMEEKEIFLKKD